MLVLAHYPICLEVAGEFGMFADPLSGSESYSYPFPPISACRGMITSVCKVFGVKINIVAVATCSKPKWTPCAYNSYSPIRKPDLIKKDAPLQIRENMLFNPCFQILAVLHNDAKEAPENWRVPSPNPAHMFQDKYMRRLRNGRCFRYPSIGRKELLVNYYGAFKSKVQNDYNCIIPSMCVETFIATKLSPRYMQNVAITSGILHYDTNFDVCLKNGMLAFTDQRYQDRIEWLSVKHQKQSA